MNQESQTTSSRPGIILSAFCLAIALLLSPDVLDNCISLHWNIGNMRYVAIALQIGAGIFACLLFLARRGVTRIMRRLFPTPRRVVFVAILVGLSIGFMLVASEVALHFVGYSFTDRWLPSENTLAKFDRELGWSYITDRSYDRPVPGTDRSLVTHFNDIGVRVRTAGQSLDPQTESVLFVGCSFTMGHGVSYENSLPGQFEDLAQPHDYQAVNMGVQAYGTDQALLRLEQQITRFNAKAVVYTFIDGHINRNAVADRRMLLPSARFLGTKPRFSLRSNGELYQRDIPLLYEDLKRRRLGEMIEYRWTMWGPVPSLNLTQALVRRMAEISKKHGAAFTVIYWTWHPPRADRLRALFGGLEEHVVVPAESAPAGWSDWQLDGDEHPNPRAHAYVAQLLRTKLREHAPDAARTN